MLLPPLETKSAASGDATIAAKTPITNAASTLESVLIGAPLINKREYLKLMACKNADVYTQKV